MTGMPSLVIIDNRLGLRVRNQCMLPRCFDPPRMSRGLSQRETLQQQCTWFILMHLEEIPPSYLALLPLSIRKELLNRLPVADVCLLGESPFVHGLDLKSYWRSCLSVYQEQLSLCLDLRKICEAKWGPMEFAKVCFYSEIAESIVNRTTENLGIVIAVGTSRFHRHTLPYRNEVNALCFAIRSVIPETES